MTQGPKHRLGRALLCGAVMLCVVTQSAPAGPLGLPVPSPGPILRNTVETVRDTLNKVTNTVTGTVDQALNNVPVDLAGRPVDPAQFEQDDKGARVVLGIILAVSLSDHGRDAAEALDLDITGHEELDSLNLDVTRLKLPPGLSAVAAIKALHEADPQGTYDFDHIYDPSGETGAGAGTVTSAAVVVPRDAIKIGMIDSGIERSHPAFHDADIVVKNITARRPSPATEHGTAVASLLVGDDRDFQGALVGATLYAADVFGGVPTGGAADDIARGIAWLADEETPVINISITGPKNALLEAAVRAALARGHIIVAAVGNDGPAVSVKYPAAYDGVIAVTSIDAQGRVQIDANRGSAIAFAARGVDVRVATSSGEYGNVTGTSFASPIVAARFAELMPQVDVSAVQTVRQSLVAAVRPPHRGKRDPVYGFGILDGERDRREVSAAH